MNKKGIWAVIVIVIIVLVVWGVQGSSQSEVIKIGYVGPFTGPVAGTSGEVVANSWKLAVAEKGTIAGKKIEAQHGDREHEVLDLHYRPLSQARYQHPQINQAEEKETRQ